jgi:hypothetical protein
MSLYYRIAKPNDLRDLADQMAAWIEADNPKRLDWAEQPSPPDYDPATHHAPEWADGQWVSTPLTPEEIAASARKIWPNAATFLAEFTMPELAAISLSLDPTIAALRLLLASWPADIYSDDPRIIGGLSALVAVGIITESRRGEILAK